MSLIELGRGRLFPTMDGEGRSMPRLVKTSSDGEVEVDLQLNLEEMQNRSPSKTKPRLELEHPGRRHLDAFHLMRVVGKGGFGTVSLYHDDVLQYIDGEREFGGRGKERWVQETEESCGGFA